MQSFFPSPEPQPEPDRFTTPEWVRAPEDEYPARIPVRQFLARNPGTVLTVSHVDVFSTGVAIRIEWEARRLDETQAEWQLTTFQHLHAGLSDESALRFGVALADGIVVTTVDPWGVDDFTKRPTHPVLRHQGGGGGGGDSRYSGSSDLWLWPMPPSGDIELVAEWADRDVPESRLTLDGKSIDDAKGDVRSLWI